MVICGKFSCNHCEKVFDFKNKLHDYIRNHECQKLLFSKSDVVIKIVLIKLFTLEKNVINDANTVIIKAITFIFIIKSIAIYKTDLSLFFTSETVFNNADNTFSKTSAILSLTYRAISFSPFIYKSYKKLYLTIVDLYMRYASLSRFSFNKITRIMIVFLIMFMQDLYEKFQNKEKRVILTLSKILDSPIKQHAIR